MGSRLRTALAALLVPMALVLSSAPPADASYDEWYCVDGPEYAAVHKGMKMKRVHEIFGIDGTGYDLGTPNVRERWYDHCIQDYAIRVTFVNYRQLAPGGPWRLSKKWNE